MAQDGTVAAPDSDEPIVTNAMIAAGLSQLPSIDWTLAEITRTLRRVYVQMWRLRRRAAALPARPHFSDASSFQIGVSRGRCCATAMCHRSGRRARLDAAGERRARSCTSVATFPSEGCAACQGSWLGTWHSLAQRIARALDCNWFFLVAQRHPVVNPSVSGTRLLRGGCRQAGPAPCAARRVIAARPPPLAVC